MTTPLQETPVEALPLTEVAEPLLEPSSALRLSRHAAGLVADAGRIGVIWLPVYALLASHFDSLRTLVGVAALVTGVWYLALQAAFAGCRPTLSALGPAVAAAIGTATGFFAVSALTLWVPGVDISAGRLLVISGSVLCLSAVWEGLVHRSIAGQRRVLVIGASEGSELIEELQLRGDNRFEVVGLVDDERESDRVAGVPLRGTIADLPAIVESQRPDVVVLTGERRTEAFSRLLEVARAGFKVVGLADFYEHAFGRVPVRSLSATWFMSVLHLYQRPYPRFAKRAFDLVVASFGLLVTAPLWPLVYLLVRRTPGPVIYRQVRLGEGGKPYTMYKFRTMVADAEAQGAVFATACDPRVTGVGRLLRQTRIDELPQLWNVLKGDMSIVGPRPERPEFWTMLEEAVPFWTHRNLVKPGITGWAQVSGGYAHDSSSTSHKLSYDLWYLRHRSLVIDVAICMKTFSTLLSGSGAR